VEPEFRRRPKGLWPGQWPRPFETAASRPPQGRGYGSAMLQMRSSYPATGSRLRRARWQAPAGYPVRRGLSVQLLLPLEYWIIRSSGQLRTRRMMTT